MAKRNKPSDKALLEMGIKLNQMCAEVEQMLGAVGKSMTTESYEYKTIHDVGIALDEALTALWCVADDRKWQKEKLAQMYNGKYSWN